MLELLYLERDTNFGSQGIHDFIGPATLSVTGMVIMEFYCPQASPTHLFVGPGTSVAFRNSPAGESFAEMSDIEGSLDAPVYGRMIVGPLDAGDYSFGVEVHIDHGSVTCEPPLLPAWFRVIGDPFAPPPGPPLGKLKFSFGVQ